MKKAIYILIVIAMLVSITACESKKEVSEDSGNVVIIDSESTTAAGASDSGNAISMTPSPTIQPTPASVSDVQLTPGTTPGPTPKPSPSTTPSPRPAVITKNPTGESVTEGEQALFISYADNSESITWILVSPDQAIVYNWNDVPKAFSGVSTTGQGTTNAYIYNIPMSMNGWIVQAYFTGYNGPVYSNGAVINVSESDAYFRQKANDARNAAMKPADYYRYYLSDIQNYVWNKETDTASFELTYNSGTINLITTIEISRSLDSYIPTCLRWYDGNQFVAEYRYDTEDPNIWYTLSGTIEEITLKYAETETSEDEHARNICVSYRDTASAAASALGFSTGELMNFYFDPSAGTGGAEVQFSNENMFFVLSMRVNVNDGSCYPSSMYCYRDGGLIGTFSYEQSGRVWQEWESDFFNTARSPAADENPEPEQQTAEQTEE